MSKKKTLTMVSLAVLGVILITAGTVALVIPIPLPPASLTAVEVEAIVRGKLLDLKLGGLKFGKAAEYEARYIGNHIWQGRAIEDVTPFSTRNPIVVTWRYHERIRLFEILEGYKEETAPFLPSLPTTTHSSPYEQLFGK